MDAQSTLHHRAQGKNSCNASSVAVRMKQSYMGHCASTPCCHEGRNPPIANESVATPTLSCLSDHCCASPLTLDCHLHQSHAVASSQLPAPDACDTCAHDTDPLTPPCRLDPPQCWLARVLPAPGSTPCAVPPRGTTHDARREAAAAATDCRRATLARTALASARAPSAGARKPPAHSSIFPTQRTPPAPC